MLSEAFFGMVALLYYLAFLLLAGLTLFIACRGRRARSRFQLRRAFYLLSLSLLLWQLTLFLEPRATPLAVQLWLGRTNFAAVAFAAYFALRFVQAVPVRRTETVSRVSWPLRVETGLLAGVTLLTPLVTESERVAGGQALSDFGPLFPFYLLHVLGYLTAALLLSLRKRRLAKEREARRQLTLLCAGMFVTGGVGVLTNALLPYRYGDFRYCDIGTLSTMVFALCVAYAAFFHRLFEARLLLRVTLVYGTLLAFLLSIYGATALLLTQHLATGSSKRLQFAALLLAFCCDPLRRFLEKKVDSLLFGPTESPPAPPKQRRKAR